MPPPDPARPIIGWDVGGAHLKAALLVDGRIGAVAQRPCPLWQGMEHLDRALDGVLGTTGFAADAAHAITMTGEMADFFADRRDGVARIAAHLRRRLGARTRFFGGAGRWHAAEGAGAHWRDIASANWVATATLVAAVRRDALLVDIGSTTTDLVPIVRARIASRGHDDASRLEARELVYHGVARTPLAALARRIGFRGREFNVMNEWFATTADVYRLTAELATEHDQHPPADNGDKGERATCARIARMIGHEGSEATAGEWRTFATAWRDLQLVEIASNMRHVVADAGLPDEAAVVGAGCGDFLARELASRSGRGYVAFDSLVAVDPACASWARVCAPSVAVAALFAEERDPCGS